MRLNVSLNISKKLASLLLLALLVISAGILIGVSHTNANPLPGNIKKSISYKVIYPSKTDQIEDSSYQYQGNDKTLTFQVRRGDKTIVFTEQPAPDSLTNAQGQVYYPALGIHPYAQFQTQLGPVALTKFYKTGNLQQVGQSAVLASKGTLLIANSQKNLTNAEWKDLFNSLKVTK